VATTQQKLEIVRCGRDPIYFMTKYGRVRTPVGGNVPFRLWPFQEECINDFMRHRLNIVLKARQLGLSTVTAVYALWMAIFQKDRSILVIATKLPTAINFIKKVKFALQNLPPWLVLPRLVGETKSQLTFSNGSEITATPTSEDAGRSEALSLLIIDEAAWIRNFEDIWTGLQPTISTGGRAIVLSTPNGVGGQYFRLWTDAVAELNDFNHIKLLWSVRPDHDQEWFEKETRGMGKRKVSQEYLCVAGTTRIVTVDGYKEAAQIAVGDRVLTHTGVFRRVTRTSSRLVEKPENLYRVSTPCNRQGDIVITGNHPLWVSQFAPDRKVKGSKLQRLQACSDDAMRRFVSIDDLLAQPRGLGNTVFNLFPVVSKANVVGGLDRVDMLDLCPTARLVSLSGEPERVAYPHQWGSNARYVELDYDAGRLVGLYLAEGCVCRASVDGTMTQLAFHIDERDTLVEFARSYMVRHGARVRVYERPNGTNRCNIQTNNRFFAGLFRMFVKGTYAPDKLLDWDLLMRTNLAFIKGLMVGYFEGDGTHAPTKKLAVSSASWQLLYQVRNLLAMFGHYPRFGYLTDRQALLELDGVNGKKLDILLQSTKTALERPGSRTRLIGDEFFAGSASFRPIENDGMLRVYSFEVEEDGTYVADSIVVHNCDFLSSGETFLQPEDLEWLRACAKDPIEKKGFDRGVWVWAHPKPLHRYVISSDVARGTSGDKGDYSTFHVIDCDECEVAAEYMGRIPPDKLGDLLNEWGLLYNKALIAPENNTFGFTTCTRLRDHHKYPRLYYNDAVGNAYDYRPYSDDELPGFPTQGNTRPQILTKLEELVRNRVIKIYSRRFCDQMQAFVWVGAKAKAGKDSHDDLVIGLAIGAWLLDGLFGGGVRSSASQAALLGSVTVSRRDVSTMPSTTVTALVNPRIVASLQHAVYGGIVRAPRPGALNDFSWLGS
jgi:hypothetical protein